MKRLEHTSVPVIALSHTGMKRKQNEDRFGVTSFSLGPNGPQPVLLAVLCDGIGGHRAGEVAAELAVERISHVVAASNAETPPEILVRAVHTASDAIRQQAASSEEMAGMGATCAVAWLIGSRLYTATVGDSRIYLIRGGRIQRISTDHTWVQEALENGYIQPEDIRGHPNAHVIRRYLGSPYLPEVDLRLRLSGQENDEQAAANQGLTLAPGDRILLTSDGLTDLVSDQEILAAYLNRSPEEASQSLIDLSNARGGHDNITLVSFSAPDQSVQLPVPVQKTRSNSRGLRWVLAGCAGTLAVVALIGLVVGGWWLMNSGAVGSRVTPTLTPTVAPAILSSPTLQGLPSSTPQRTVAPLPTDTPTRIPLLPGGPTLTPWPTNTPRTP